MRTPVKEFLLTATTLAMAVGGPPLGALAQNPPLKPPILPSLVAIDAGDSCHFDLLPQPTEARPTEARHGNAADAALVAWTRYDLSTRPAAESVGSRAPLGWTYDLWNRPAEVTLPPGVGRSPTGTFVGFRREFNSLDQQIDVTAVGQLISAAFGAGWAWGGAARLYGITTRGP